jgi:hypothetical protein
MVAHGWNVDSWLLNDSRQYGLAVVPPGTACGLEPQSQVGGLGTLLSPEGAGESSLLLRPAKAGWDLPTAEPVGMFPVLARRRIEGVDLSVA